MTSCVLFQKREKKYEMCIRTEILNGVKHGFCLLCREKNQSNVIPIPVKSGNTSRVKLHHKNFHPKEFKLIFPNSVSTEQPTLKELFSPQAPRTKINNKQFKKMTVYWAAYRNLVLKFFDDEVTQNYFNGKFLFMIF